MKITDFNLNSPYRRIIALIIIICGALWTIPVSADSCKPTKCPTTCSASSSGNCNKKMDANCIVNNNNSIEGGSCFNNVPVTSTSSLAAQCSQDGKMEGTSFAVGTFSKDNPSYVKAAAKGKVVYAGASKDGAGRIVVIEHEKGCEDDSHGDTNKYTTTYSHLLSYNVSIGQIVNMNDIIGIVGGSTSNENGICDNDSQAGIPPHEKSAKFSKSGCNEKSKTDIQLGFMVNDGPATETKAASNTLLNSNCDDMQNYCGGCSSHVTTCYAENPAEYREVVASSTNADYYNKNAKATAKASCEKGFFIDEDSCLFCGLFKDIFNAASAIAKIANDGLATPTKNLVGIGFLIWLAIFVLKNVSSFGETKISDTLKAVLFQGFRVTVVMLILGGAIYQVMDLTINPIMQTGLSFARTVSADDKVTCSSDAEYLQGIIGYDSNKGFKKNDSGGLSKQLGIAYICSIKKIEDGVKKLVSYGNYSNCLAFNDFPSLGFIPHMGFLTTGTFLYIVGIVLLLMFPWFLIDCLLQLCIAVALLPCAIGAFAFKVTSKYLKVLWQYFMNSMFNFVFISIIIFIVSANFKTWLGYDFDSNEIDPNIFINATNNGLAWWGTTAFRLAGVCFFCFIFLSEAKEMSNKFASGTTLGGGKGIGTMFGGLAFNSGLSLGKAGLQASGKVGGKTIDTLEESMSSLVGGQAKSMSNHTKGVFIGALGGEKITDDKGNVVGYRRNLKLFGKNYTTEYSKDDKGVWSSRTVKNNSETIDDTILETKLTKNNNGDIVGITTKAKTVSSNYLINADKTINQNAVNQLLANSGNKEYAARHIVGEVMKSRGIQLDDKFLSSETKINGDNYDSFTIIQKNEDGKLQTINANLDKETGIMTIKSDIDDGSGNITSTVSDGLNPVKNNTHKANDPAVNTSASSSNRTPT